MFAVPADRFEELISEALETIPAELRSAIDNVAIIVEDEAIGRPLFGLYQGIPLTRRLSSSYSGVMPDRITLYQNAICRVCESEEAVRMLVRKTVIHEVAHHFGIGDQRLRELGWS